MNILGKVNEIFKISIPRFFSNSVPNPEEELIDGNERKSRWQDN
jgi:hypothetical protein